MIQTKSAFCKASAGISGKIFINTSFQFKSKYIIGKSCFPQISEHKTAIHIIHLLWIVSSQSNDIAVSKLNHNVINRANSLNIS